MPFPEQLGVFACTCVIFKDQPVCFVSHAGGGWQMYCSDKNHDFEDEEGLLKEIKTVHIHHLLCKDPTLNEVCDLPVDMGAEREYAGAPWKYFPDKDDD